jgi:hypothetical protein
VPDGIGVLVDPGTTTSVKVSSVEPTFRTIVWADVLGVTAAVLVPEIKMQVPEIVPLANVIAAPRPRTAIVVKAFENID